MSYIIKGEDVRVGDKIRVAHDMTVTNSTFEEDGEVFSGEANHWVDIGHPSTVIELISRPVPDLPTERGSVISLKHPSITRGAHWMLLDTGEWVSLLDIHKSPEDLREFIQRSKLTFDVIA